MGQNRQESPYSHTPTSQKSLRHLRRAHTSSATLPSRRQFSTIPLQHTEPDIQAATSSTIAATAHSHYREYGNSLWPRQILEHGTSLACHIHSKQLIISVCPFSFNIILVSFYQALQCPSRWHNSQKISCQTFITVIPNLSKFSSFSNILQCTYFSKYKGIRYLSLFHN